MLSYIEKGTCNNSFKELEEDLNFIEHISGLGEGGSKNVSNNSSVITKRKSFDCSEADNDLLKFVMLQAAALEKILPDAGTESSNREYWNQYH